MQDFHRTQIKIVIGMTGLPARGKTHISNKINRFLNWLGYKSQVFSVIDVMKAQQGVDYDPEIYDPDNTNSVQLREEYSMMAVEQLIRYMSSDGDVAIFNATNAHSAFRIKVKNEITRRIPGCSMFWVESICNNEQVILKNVQLTKLNSSRYIDLTKLEAQKDYMQKIEQLAKRFETIDETEKTSYIKIIDIGQKIYIHQIAGYLQSKIVSFLMNLHIYDRPIYFCRTGETQFMLDNKIGGDSELTDKGIKLAHYLANFFKLEFQDYKKIQGIKILSSTMKRSMLTSEVLEQALGVNSLRLKTLDELDFGDCDGMLYGELNKKYPEKIKEREKDKLRFRFPRGESYLDLISRIEPVIFQIERFRTPVIIIAHQAILRCLYAYFHQDEIKDIPTLDIPINVVIKLMGGKETRIRLDPLDGHVINYSES